MEESTPYPGTISWENATEPFLPDGILFHPYWHPYREFFENVPDLVHYALGIYIAVVCLFACAGNLLVIWIFVSTRSLRTPSNMFIVNLAISDLGFSAINGFPLMTISSFQRAWYFGGLACDLYGAIGGMTGFNSIASLACISMDRYYVIAKPLEAMRKATKKRALLQIMFCWIWASVWSFPPLFGWGRYIPEGLQTWCSFDYLTRDWNTFSYNMCLFVFGFCTPVSVIAYCYINIIRAVINQKKEMAKTAEKMGATTSKDERAKKQEIALAKIAFTTVSLFCISWLPYAFITQCGVWGLNQFVNPYTCIAPVSFAKAGAIWNPIIYALSHPRFRAQLDARFPWLLCCAGKNIDKEETSKQEVSRDVEMKGKAKMTKSTPDTDDTSSVCTELSESGYTTDYGHEGGKVSTIA